MKLFKDLGPSLEAGENCSWLHSGIVRCQQLSILSGSQHLPSTDLPILPNCSPQTAHKKGSSF